MRLFRLAWDLLGSDFAGRHLQYEKFYAGPSFVMNSYSYSTAPWQSWTSLVDEAMNYGSLAGVGRSDPS
jgi:4-hydroxyphenylacetate 3-monooxygenase